MESLSVASLNSVNPSLKGIPAILHAARNGDDTGLKELFQQTTSMGLSYDTCRPGLHMATLCSRTFASLGPAQPTAGPRWMPPYDGWTRSGCIRTTCGPRATS